MAYANEVMETTVLSIRGGGAKAARFPGGRANDITTVEGVD